jgi:hypothetical protein
MNNQNQREKSMREYAHFKEQFKEQYWRPERSSNAARQQVLLAGC